MRYHALNLVTRYYDGKEWKWKCADIETQRHVVRSIALLLDSISAKTSHHPLIKSSISFLEDPYLLLLLFMGLQCWWNGSAGGGMKELFRKVENRSSEFHPEVRRVRREGSYINEEFMPTGGTDVKVVCFGICMSSFWVSFAEILLENTTFS